MFEQLIRRFGGTSRVATVISKFEIQTVNRFTELFDQVDSLSVSEPVCQFLEPHKDQTRRTICLKIATRLIRLDKRDRPDMPY